ncbi:MAG: type III pantothenate kinase, partial [Desulfobacterales bacterium]|nr:type III pantothenate kinase [Desulfobacterales bacterium]
MLLVIDVGNTNTLMGIYDGRTLVKSWRVRTERNITEDEFFLLITGLFAGGRLDLGIVKKTIISCVVPPVVFALDSFCRKYLGRAPSWVDAGSLKKMPNRYGNPAEVGADRIVNAIAAYDKYPVSLIVIDFGTAT